MCSTQKTQFRNYMELSYGALKGLEHALGDADVHSVQEALLYVTAVCAGPKDSAVRMAIAYVLSI